MQIISLKNVPHGFSKKFSAPNLISEAVLFINYLSVSVLDLIFRTIETRKSNFGWILFSENLERSISYHPSLSEMKHNHHVNCIPQKDCFGCFFISLEFSLWRILPMAFNLSVNLIFSFLLVHCSGESDVDFTDGVLSLVWIWTNWFPDLGEKGLQRFGKQIASPRFVSFL